MTTIPEFALNNQVTDVKDIYEFAHKYRKPERFHEKGQQFVISILQSHEKDIQEFGYACISKHDSVTGKFVCFIPRNKNN